MSQEPTAGPARPPRPRGARDELWARELLDSALVCLSFKDLDGRYLRVSVGFAARHGRTPDELVGLSDADLLDHEHARAARADEETVVRTGRPIVHEALLEQRPGMPLTWVARSTFPLSDHDGTTIGTFAISRDITERMLVEQDLARAVEAAQVANAELRRVEAQLRSVLDTSTDAIAQYAPDLTYRYLNQAGERRRGLPLAELVGRTDRAAGLDDASADIWEAALRRAVESGLRGDLEYSVLTDGHEEWFHTSVAPETDAEGGVVGVMTSTRDVTAKKKAELALAHQALHDPTTGLANRYLLMDRLGRALLRLERAPGGVALFFIDVDHFKAVNDTYGHDVGDQVLIELARRLHAIGRKEDTIARLGGDEFVVLCENVLGDGDARDIAERIVQVLGTPVDQGAMTVHVSVSVGAAVATEAGTPAGDLLRDADGAMYRVKQEGRNGFVLHDPQTRSENDGRLRLEAELRLAVPRGELSLLYQPQLSITGHRLLGFAALLRWNHPELGTLEPPDFLPAAERIGLTGAIGTWVLDTACRTLARWNAEVSAEQQLSVAVPVSASQLRGAGLVQRVAGALATHGVEPSLLRLEISERALLDDDHPRVAAVLQDLAALGVQLAVDDFGASVTSLTRLPRIPLGVVRLDPLTDTSRAEVLAAVIATARGLGMSVVGGGVEDASHLAAFTALARDGAQGFLVARPLEESAAEALIATGWTFSGP